MKIILLLLASLILYTKSFDDGERIQQFNRYVIHLANKGVLVKRPQGSDERFEGKYLGNIKTESGKVYHIVNFSRIFNLKNSPTAESHIFIYDNKLRYIGNYYLTLISELPDYISKQKLYFMCDDRGSGNVVDFAKGIPPLIQFKCHNEKVSFEFQK